MAVDFCVLKHETLLPLMLILCVPITELIPMCLEVNFEFDVLKHYCSYFETTLHLMLMFCAYKWFLTVSHGSSSAFNALMLLVGRQWWGPGKVICLERDAYLHMAQLMPLPLTVSCSSKIQIGFTFLILAHLGSPGKRAVKRACMCVSHGSSGSIGTCGILLLLGDYSNAEFSGL